MRAKRRNIDVRIVNDALRADKIDLNSSPLRMHVARSAVNAASTKPANHRPQPAVSKIASDVVRFAAKLHHLGTNRDREGPNRRAAPSLLSDAAPTCFLEQSSPSPRTDAAIDLALLLQVDQRIDRVALDTHSSQQKRLLSAEAYPPKWQSLIASSDAYGLTEDIAQAFIGLGIKHRNGSNAVTRIIPYDKKRTPDARSHEMLQDTDPTEILRHPYSGMQPLPADQLPGPVVDLENRTVSPVK